MERARSLVFLVAIALVAAGCGASSSTAVEGITITTTTVAAGTTAAAADTTEASTTTTAAVTEIDLTIEPSGWEDVTITTEDGLALYGRFWEGNDTAVLFGHDFDNPTPGSGGQRAPQSSEAVLPWSSAIAREGYTVLSVDFRGHGQSEGEYNVRESQLDLAAMYQWLETKGYDRIVMIGWVGSGTAAVVLDAERDDLEFDGIAMVFSPPQDTGLDASRVLPEIEAPTYFIGTEAGRSASWAKRLEAKAVDSRGVFVFERVPSGVQFIDVFGAELAGRLVDFVASV